MRGYNLPACPPVMNKFVLCAISLTLAACQANEKPADRPPAAAVAAADTAAAARPEPRPAAASLPTDSLTSYLLQRYRLAPLWANRATADAAPGSAPPMEGFFGPRHYRISFYLSEVQSDSTRHNLFYVKGLRRYQQEIAPFEGRLEVQQILPFTTPMARPANAPAYTAVSRFELETDPIGEAGGTYTGRAFLDFYLTPDDQPAQLLLPFGAADANPTKGTGLLFRGDFVSPSTQRRQEVAFANDYAAVLPPALADMNLSANGARENAVLAELGWTERWQNDEWWRAPISSPFNL